MIGIVLALLLAGAVVCCYLFGLIEPLRALLRKLPAGLRGVLRTQDLAGLQRQAAAEAVRLALVAVDARYLPNEIVVLLHPDDHAKMRPLEQEFCRGIADLLEAEVRNGPRDKGLPYKTLGSPTVKTKPDARVFLGTATATGALVEETAHLSPEPPPAVAVLDLGDRQVPLGGEVLVGRATYADVRIEAAGVSREHAKLSCRGAGVLVTDLGGHNGTLVNGEPVAPGRVARAAVGDRIGFGPGVVAELKLSPDARDLCEHTTAPLSRR